MATEGHFGQLAHLGSEGSDAGALPLGLVVPPVPAASPAAAHTVRLQQSAHLAQSWGWSRWQGPRAAGSGSAHGGVMKHLLNHDQINAANSCQVQCNALHVWPKGLLLSPLVVACRLEASSLYSSLYSTSNRTASVMHSLPYAIASHHPACLNPSAKPSEMPAGSIQPFTHPPFPPARTGWQSAAAPPTPCTAAWCLTSAA